MMNQKNKGKTGGGLSDWLQRKAEKVPLRIQKTFFIAGIFLAAVYCGMLVGGMEESKLPLTNIAVPSISGTDRQMLSNRVYKLKQYLDSLGRSEPGRLERDSLLQKNPGLMDSIRVWEERIRELQ